MDSVRPVIAIVEDDFALSEALERLLRVTGFEAVVFSDPKKLHCSDRFEELACLVLDLHLPGGSGFELMDRLRQDEVPLPVILMTADDSPATLSRAAQSQCSALLLKPFEAPDLLACIRDVLR
ncbi:MAG: response regulator [Verrucomicrobia bacterium]|nr:response regulator [Verrucomicrobiota bacterium]